MLWPDQAVIRLSMQTEYQHMHMLHSYLKHHLSMGVLFHWTGIIHGYNSLILEECPGDEPGRNSQPSSCLVLMYHYGALCKSCKLANQRLLRLFAIYDHYPIDRRRMHAPVETMASFEAQEAANLEVSFFQQAAGFSG